MEAFLWLFKLAIDQFVELRFLHVLRVRDGCLNKFIYLCFDSGRFDFLFVFSMHLFIFLFWDNISLGLPNPIFSLLNRRFEFLNARLFIFLSFQSQLPILSPQSLYLAITFLKNFLKLLSLLHLVSVIDHALLLVALALNSSATLRSLFRSSGLICVLLEVIPQLFVEFVSKLELNLFHLALNFLLECAI